MALTATQIVTLACQIAKCPGFTSQAGQLLNSILDELCQTYDFQRARTAYSFNLSSATGSGPYSAPSDYLRTDKEGFFYTINGVKYVMINIELNEYNSLVQNAGMMSYPQLYATDQSTDPVGIYVWAPPSGSYPCTLLYYRQMPSIATPETSSTVPWFLNTNYLTTRLAGELMKITDDDRAAQFLGGSPEGAQGILDRFLKLQNDDLNRSQRVELDRRFFGRHTGLRNTKQIGW